MKKRILTLALALILLLSVVTVPARAAAAKDVYNFLKSYAMKGEYDAANKVYSCSMETDLSATFIVRYLEKDKYVETSFFDGYEEVTWRISSNPSPAYKAYFRADYEGVHDQGTVSITASYNGEKFTAFDSYTGDPASRSVWLDWTSNTFTILMELTRKLLFDNGYTLADLGLSYSQCKWIHTYEAPTVVLEPSCDRIGILSYHCSSCNMYSTEQIPPLGHAWAFTEVQTEAEEGGLHACTALYTCTRCEETKEARLCAEEVFTDMPAEGNWAHDPIDWAYFNGITAGKTPTTFAPKDTVTRAEAMTFLWKTLGSPEPETTENPFTDVPEGKYFYKPVLWAVENEITGGATPTTFAPKSKCTRAQIMMFIWAAAGRPEPETTENPFADVDENKYYYKAVLWAVENEITGGIAADKFGPNNTCTRAQIVTFLYKAEPLLTAEKEPVCWFVIGNICGTNWDEDFPMAETEKNVFESEILELHAGEEFKVRTNHSWETNFGSDGWGGDNFIVTEDGHYIVRLDLNNEVLSLVAR